MTRDSAHTTPAPQAAASEAPPTAASAAKPAWEAVYDAQIQPLMAEVHRLCEAAGLPFWAIFQLTDDEDTPTMCTESDVPLGSASVFYHLHNVVRFGMTSACFAHLGDIGTALLEQEEDGSATADGADPDPTAPRQPPQYLQ